MKICVIRYPDYGLWPEVEKLKAGENVTDNLDFGNFNVGIFNKAIRIDITTDKDSLEIIFDKLTLYGSHQLFQTIGPIGVIDTHGQKREYYNPINFTWIGTSEFTFYTPKQNKGTLAKCNQSCFISQLPVFIKDDNMIYKIEII